MFIKNNKIFKYRFFNKNKSHKYDNNNYYVLLSKWKIYKLKFNLSRTTFSNFTQLLFKFNSRSFKTLKTVKSANIFIFIPQIKNLYKIKNATGNRVYKKKCIHHKKKLIPDYWEFIIIIFVSS